MYPRVGWTKNCAAGFVVCVVVSPTPGQWRKIAEISSAKKKQGFDWSAPGVTCVHIGPVASDESTE